MNLNGGGGGGGTFDTILKQASKKKCVNGQNRTAYIPVFRRAKGGCLKPPNTLCVYAYTTTWYIYIYSLL